MNMVYRLGYTTLTTNSFSNGLPSMEATIDTMFSTFSGALQDTDTKATVNVAIPLTKVDNKWVIEVSDEVVNSVSDPFPPLIDNAGH